MRKVPRVVEKPCEDPFPLPSHWPITIPTVVLLAVAALAYLLCCFGILK